MVVVLGVGLLQTIYQDCSNLLSSNFSTFSDSDVQVDDLSTHTKEDENANLEEKKKATPGQDKTQQKINAVQKELTKLYKLRDCGILPDDGKKAIKNLQSELHKLELALNRKKKDAERKRVGRTKFKDKLTEISLANPEVDQQLAKFIRQEVGRPRIETDQKGLLDAIVSIASYGAAADDRRRTEMLKSCKSLDDLQSK